MNIKIYFGRCSNRTHMYILIWQNLPHFHVHIFLFRTKSGLRPSLDMLHNRFRLPFGVNVCSYIVKIQDI